MLSGSSRDETWLLVISFIIFAFSFVGNILVIFVILSLKEYKKSITHLYILQLAAADIMFTIYIPLHALADWENKWLYGDAFCPVEKTLMFLSYYASILLLVVMSCDRYVAVCHPFNTTLQQLRSANASRIISVVTWCLALVCCIPVMMNSFIDIECHCSIRFQDRDEYKKLIAEDYNNCVNEYPEFAGFCEFLNPGEDHCAQKDPVDPFELLKNFTLPPGSFNFTSPDINSTFNPIIYDESFIEVEQGAINEFSNVGATAGTCHIVPDDPASDPWKNFVLFNFFAMFLFPLLVLTVTYTLIIRRIKATQGRAASTRASTKSGAKGKSGAGAKDERSKITITCGSLVVCFTLCWLPFHVVHLSRFNGLPISGEDCSILMKITSVLGSLNSGVNPWIYAILGTNFGKRFRSIFTRSTRTTSTTGAASGVRYTRRGLSTEGTLVTKFFRSSTRKKKTDKLVNLDDSVASGNLIDDSHFDSLSIPATTSQAVA